MDSILIIIIILILFIVFSSLLEWKMNKDKELYSCYLKMFHKGYASGSSCCGLMNTLDPEYSKCEHCYYHKIYLKEKGIK